MILLIGPLYAGQRKALEQLAAEQEKDLSNCRVYDLAEFLWNPESEGDFPVSPSKLYNADYVLAVETGAGLIPLHHAQRAFREAVGSMNYKLAQKADEVYRVVCGIPVRIK